MAFCYNLQKEETKIWLGCHWLSPTGQVRCLRFSSPKAWASSQVGKGREGKRGHLARRLARMPVGCLSHKAKCQQSHWWSTVQRPSLAAFSPSEQPSAEHWGQDSSLPGKMLSQLCNSRWMSNVPSCHSYLIKKKVTNTRNCLTVTHFFSPSLKMPLRTEYSSNREAFVNIFIF